MTAASAFSGCGCADYGLMLAGFDHLWFCEVVPVRRSVLRRHWPDRPICEDVKTLAQDIDDGKYAAPDLFWFSPPCQDISVAGLKRGLAGARSGLFFDGINAVRALRDRGTRYVIMEQVAGLLNSDSRSDFVRVISEFTALGAVSWGYRVFDSQYFGVAQVRRRVFFVLDFAGGRARKILFDSDRVPRCAAQGGGAGQEAAGRFEDCTGERGELGSLSFDCNKSANEGSSLGIFNDIAPSVQTDKASAVLTFPDRDYGGSSKYQSRRDKTQTVGSHGPDCVLTFASVTSSKGAGRRQCDDDNLAVEIGCPEKAKTVISSRPTLNALGGEMVATFDRRQITSPDHTRTMEHDRPCGTVNDRAMGLVKANRVRRLTPVETERLFGLDDDYTRWDDTGKEIKDSPRYEMLGDGVVSNCSQWLGENIIAVSN